MRGRDKFRRAKALINILVKVYSVLPHSMRVKLFEHYRMTKGSKGLVIRYVLLKTLTKSCGDNVSIHPNVYLLNVQNMSVGNNVSIHPMCYIECGNSECGGVVIGDDVSIAHGVSIMATSHRFANLDISIKDQGIESKEVVIGNGVWIGAKATMLYGNTLGDGSIIGANAVVTRNVKQNSVVGGVPAKIIKMRNNAVVR